MTDLPLQQFRRVVRQLTKTQLKRLLKALEKKLEREHFFSPSEMYERYYERRIDVVEEELERRG